MVGVLDILVVCLDLVDEASKLNNSGMLQLHR